MPDPRREARLRLVAGALGFVLALLAVGTLCLISPDMATLRWPALTCVAGGIVVGALCLARYRALDGGQPTDGVETARRWASLCVGTVAGVVLFAMIPWAGEFAARLGTGVRLGMQGFLALMGILVVALGIQGFVRRH